jgi:AcrR family transcriptional regulator
MSHKNKTYRRRLSTASDARALRTRDALRRALLVLLEKKRFGDLSIPKIAATAGIGYATFYRHYPTKNALLADLAAAEVRDLIHLTLPLMDAQRTAAAGALLARVVVQPAIGRRAR